jgi:Na+/melibiose symporter-like transporter
MDSLQKPHENQKLPFVSDPSISGYSIPVEELPTNSDASSIPLESRVNSLQDLEKAPYHIFTKRQKWVLVYIVSLAAMFSPLSSNIYFPAINTIATDLDTSTSLVALTVTVYMVVQGIAPSFWGPWSDIYGRRVIFISTLAVYVAANLALAFTVDYAMLLVLRGVQAAGSAATISIATGVIADVATPGESMDILICTAHLISGH